MNKEIVFEYVIVADIEIQTISYVSVTSIVYANVTLVYILFI